MKQSLSNHNYKFTRKSMFILLSNINESPSKLGRIFGIHHSTIFYYRKKLKKFCYDIEKVLDSTYHFSMNDKQNVEDLIKKIDEKKTPRQKVLEEIKQMDIGEKINNGKDYEEYQADYEIQKKKDKIKQYRHIKELNNTKDEKKLIEVKL